MSPSSAQAASRRKRVIFLALTLVLGAVFLWFLRRLEFGETHAFLKGLSNTNKAESFTPAVFAKLRLFLSAFIAFTAPALALAIWHWPRLAPLARKGGGAFAVAAQDFQNQLKRYLRKFDRRDYALATLLMIFAAYLRWHHLAKPITHDEAASYVYFGTRHVFSIFSQYVLPNNHILNSLWMKLVSVTFGPTVPALRGSAFGAGILSVGVAYFIIPFLAAGRAYRVLGACLLAVAPALIEYSTLARGYSLQGFFVLLAFAGANFWLRQQNLFTILLTSFCCALGFLCVPTMLFPFAILGLYLLLGAWQRGFVDERGKNLVAVSAAIFVGHTFLWVVLFYLPAVFFVGAQAILSNPFVLPLTFSDFARALPVLARSLMDFWGFGYEDSVLNFVLLLFVAIGLTVKSRNNPRSVILPRAFLVGLIAVLCFSRTIPPTRALLALAPLYLMTALSGIATLLEWSIAILFPKNALEERYRLLVAGVLLACLGFWSGKTLTDTRAPAKLFPDSRTLFSVDEIFQKMRDEGLGADDLVLSPFPNDIMLDFKLFVSRIPAALNRPQKKPQRIFVVYNKAMPADAYLYEEHVPGLSQMSKKRQLWTSAVDELWLHEF